MAKASASSGDRRLSSTARRDAEAAQQAVEADGRGRGAWEAVRDHGENLVVEDAFAAIPETTARFRGTGSPVEMTRPDFDAWLLDS